MTSLPDEHDSGTGLLSEQIAAIDRSPVIDLSNGTAAGTYTAAQPFRPGEHRTEAEAALSLWETACDRVNGELTGWPYAVSAIVHALLAVEERLGQR